MDRIGILTGGGDAPGLNAVIRAVVKAASSLFDCEVIGIRQGFEGLVDSKGTLLLTPDSVRGILPRGGTILGAANRGNPFARRVIKDGIEVIEDVSDHVVQRIHDLGLDTLIVVGGDGTLRICLELFQKGSPVVGVPKTIDNDIQGTDVTFGFDTAVAMATEAIDRLHTTAESHHRVMVLELMGRNAGFITLEAGIAGGADVILIPEIPFHFEPIFEKIQERARAGRYFSIIAVAEGARPVDHEQIFRMEGDTIRSPRLGGIGQYVAEEVAQTCALESRVTVLGHLQRGGTPTAFDRWLATRFGVAAVRLAANKKHGYLVGLHGTEIVDIRLEDALKMPKRVDLNGEVIQTARELGICLGD
jgi:phosphofructokinase-like protein